MLHASVCIYIYIHIYIYIYIYIFKHILHGNPASPRLTSGALKSDESGLGSPVRLNPGFFPPKP